MHLLSITVSGAGNNQDRRSSPKKQANGMIKRDAHGSRHMIETGCTQNALVPTRRNVTPDQANQVAKTKSHDKWLRVR